jgi:hypothetical protein
MRTPKKPEGSIRNKKITSLPPEDNHRKRISANDLFSLFTANIIKKKVTFTR